MTHAAAIIGSVLLIVGLLVGVGLMIARRRARIWQALHSPDDVDHWEEEGERLRRIREKFESECG